MVKGEISWRNEDQKKKKKSAYQELVQQHLVGHSPQELGEHMK